MQLYQHDFGSVTDFGSNLQRWLWPRLLPGLLDDNPQAALISSDVPLNAQLPARTSQAEDRLIFGAGADADDSMYRPGPCDRVYCVRGPLSARALGLPPEAAVTDSTRLVGRVFESPSSKHCAFAFMPHGEQIADRAWESVCIALGIGYLDPRWSAERLLHGIARSEVFITESLPGAMAADALRVPWVAVATHAHLPTFAWQDWCASLSLVYAPVPVLSLWPLSDPARGLRASTRAARDWARRATALGQMTELLRVVRPTLSRDEDWERAGTRLEERLFRLTRDVQSGEFAGDAAPQWTLQAVASNSNQAVELTMP